MHMHVIILGMRTTIDLRPEHRSALLALAARRGEKGFSSVIDEAIQAYLASERDREERRRIFRSLAGSLSRKDAEELKRSTAGLRERWR